MTFNVIGSFFFVEKTKKNDFEVNAFNEWFDECSVFLHQKTQLNVECHMYKVSLNVL